MRHNEQQRRASKKQGWSAMAAASGESLVARAGERQICCRTGAGELSPQNLFYTTLRDPGKTFPVAHGKEYANILLHLSRLVPASALPCPQPPIPAPVAL